MSAWTMDPSGETATGAPIPVIEDGELFAQVSPIWSDEDGVRVSIDWSAEVGFGVSRIEDLSAGQARALGDVLHAAAAIEPPRVVA